MAILGEIFDGLFVCDLYVVQHRRDLGQNHTACSICSPSCAGSISATRPIRWRGARHRIQRLFQDAIRLKLHRLEREPHLYQRLDLLIQTPLADRDASRLLKRLANFQGELLTFVDH